MAGAELAGVLRVVVEVFVRERAVLVADLPVRRHERRIELELHLHVFRDRDQRAGQLAHEDFLRFLQIVEIRVVAVAVIGEHLHARVLVVVVADAEGREVDAVVALLLDQLQQIVVAGDADVEVAVGGEDDAVVAAGDEVLFRDVIRELNALRSGGRAARLETIERGDDRLLVRAGRRRKHDACRAGVHDDRDAIFGAQLVDEEPERGLQQRQTRRRLHRAGDIEQEDEVVRRHAPLFEIASLDADPQQPMTAFHGQLATSVVIENGCGPVGCGYEYVK